MRKHSNTPPVPPGAQVRAGNLTTATTGAVIWLAESLPPFHGVLPGPVHAFLLLAVPAACGHLAALLAYRREVRRLDCP